MSKKIILVFYALCFHLISFSEGLPFTCYNSPIKTTDFPSTLAPTTTPAPSKYDCSFEHGWCGFGNLPKDNSHWMMHQGDGRIGIWHDHTLDNHRGESFSCFNVQIKNSLNIYPPSYYVQRSKF